MRIQDQVQASCYPRKLVYEKKRYASQARLGSAREVDMCKVFELGKGLGGTGGSIGTERGANMEGSEKVGIEDIVDADEDWAFEVEGMVSSLGEDSLRRARWEHSSIPASAQRLQTCSWHGNERRVHPAQGRSPSHRTLFRLQLTQAALTRVPVPGPFRTRLTHSVPAVTQFWQGLASSQRTLRFLHPSQRGLVCCFGARSRGTQASERETHRAQGR